MFLSTNSIICIISGLRSLDWSTPPPHLPLWVLVSYFAVFFNRDPILYWMPDIVNFTLLSAENVCIFTNILDFFLGHQQTDWKHFNLWGTAFKLC